MARLLSSPSGSTPHAANGPPSTPSAVHPFDLVEAGAGNGRLSADILRGMAANHPDVYAQTRLHLVETSDAARAAQSGTLGMAVDRLASSSDIVPGFEGVLIANELLDAMPVHQVVMRAHGLREIFVDLARSGPDGSPTLVVQEGAPSTPELAAYLSRAGVTLQPGARAEINLRAIEWVEAAASRMRRGFAILIDYGHEARELYSVSHSAGTLTSYSRHQSSGAEGARAQPAWLQRPGEQDITAHVDFTSVQKAAERAGCVTLGFLDQTYFVMGLLTSAMQGPADMPAPAGAAADAGVRSVIAEPRRRMALKTLLMPGGLGSTMKVLILGKNVGGPGLAGCSYRVRVT
jgi:SAM-dependent MidA family methyltransferase